MRLEEIYNEKMKNENIDARIGIYREKRPHYLLMIILAVIVVGIPNYFFLYKTGTTCFTGQSPVQTNSTLVSSTLSLGCTTSFALYVFASALELLIIALILLKFIEYRKVAK